MEPSAPTVLIQLVNFAVFAVIVYMFVLKPVGKALDDRKGQIRKDLDDAEQRKIEAADLKQQFELSLKEANETSADIISNAVATAENMKSSIVSEAQTSAKREKEKAQENIEQLREKALQEINSHVGSLAVQIAGKLLEDSLDKETQRKLVAGFVKKVESGNVE